MKGAPESDYNSCTGVFKPLAGENVLCINDSHAETEAAATREVVAQLCEIQTLIRNWSNHSSSLLQGEPGAATCSDSA